MKKRFKLLFMVGLLLGSSSCQQYLDIVPDNIATIDYAFRMRSTAEKYLFTCYSFMPRGADYYANPGLFGADELWLSANKSWWANWQIALGTQNINNPVLDYWNGYNNATALWQAISQCNIFLDNLDKVPDIEFMEREQWRSEVKFLKAFYHFYLLRMYGPIPIVDKNLPISASGEEVRVFRQPVDEVVDYIVRTIDDAVIDLPLEVRNENAELGRITKPIALGIKAKVLILAASPLFSNNTEYGNFRNKNGTALFNLNGDSQSKWQLAAKACEEAIAIAEEVGYGLYEFELTQQTRNISEETRIQLNNRGTLTERWNKEIIWANTQSHTRTLQVWSAPRVLERSNMGNQEPNGSIAVTMKIAELFYSNNGVPIEEDITYNYANRFSLRTATADDRFKVKEGYTTAELNFDRESRFYGSLGFDGGTWYGNGRYDDTNPHYLQIKKDQIGGKVEVGWHSVTGYYAKKYINISNTSLNQTTYTSVNWPWVMLRLSDLYLLHAEALNEISGPNDKTFDYLDRIRAKAGLEGVKNSWTKYSKNPTKFTTKEGLRSIIQRERMIEMALEGERFWDLRRWKIAPDVMNSPIYGWDVDQATSEQYYRRKMLFAQKFTLKDYFWPLRESDLIVNKNLVQNPGW